jgi:hypothetical protein
MGRRQSVRRVEVRLVIAAAAVERDAARVYRDP